MSKIIKLLCLILITPIIIFYFIISSKINTKKIKNDINIFLDKQLETNRTHYLYNNRELKAKINGNIKLKIFPSAKLIINSLELKNLQHQNTLVNGTLNKIEINIGLKNIFKKKLNFNNLLITNATIIIEKNILPNSYKTKQKVKKIIKLEQNEVLGIKDKLKEILTGTSNEEKTIIKEGFKEQIVEEEVKIQLDNENIKKSVINLLKLDLAYIDFDNKKIHININNSNIKIIKNNNLDKEYKNINLILNNRTDTFQINGKYITTNLESSINGDIVIKDDNLNLIIKLSNNENDSLTFEYKGKNNLFKVDNIFDLDGDKKINIESSSLNNFLQWFLPASSEYYTKFNYKNKISIIVDFNNISGFNINNLIIKSEDLKLNGKLKFADNNDIDINIEKINLNNFTINTKIEKSNIYENNINIFKYNNLESLLKFLNEINLEKSQKAKININIAEIINKTDTIKDSKINLEIINGNYKINNFIFNLNDLNINISNQIENNNFYINDISIKGTNFDKISQIFNLENFFEIKEFELTSKFFVYNNIIYLIDLKLHDEEQIINGDLEYSFERKNQYLAANININKIEIKHSFERKKFLKENFLLLNNIQNNIFLHLIVNKVIFNDLDIKFDSFIYYSNGLLNLYKINNIESNFFKNINGSFSLNIKNSKPNLNINLNIKEIKKEIYLLDYIINLNKYKNIILDADKEKLEESKNYWINQLFELPYFNDIFGEIAIKINNINLNSKNLNNIIIDCKIDNGVIDLNKINFNGFGGITNIRGKLDLKESKIIHLILDEAIYDLKDLVFLLINKEQDFISGKLGIGAVFKAQGYNKKIFLASENLESKFIIKNLYLKPIGIDQLKKNLNLVFENTKILESLNTQKAVLDGSGTNYYDVNGVFTIDKNLVNLNASGEGSGFASKFDLKVDNNFESPIIKLVNTNSMLINLNTKNIPLYYTISFIENFSNKAKLSINTTQIDDYLKLIKKSFKNNENEQKKSIEKVSDILEEQNQKPFNKENQKNEQIQIPAIEIKQNNIVKPVVFNKKINKSKYSVKNDLSNDVKDNKFNYLIMNNNKKLLIKC